MRALLTPIVAALTATVLLIGSALADEGVVARRSRHSVRETMDRLEQAAKQRGLVVVARINHAAGASKAGLSLRPTELLVFGNPKVGTPLMQSRQEIGLDLPLKALAWEDKAGQVWLAYNDPAHLAARHGVTNRGKIIEGMTKALQALADEATK